METGDIESRRMELNQTPNTPTGKTMIDQT